MKLKHSSSSKSKQNSSRERQDLINKILIFVGLTFLLSIFFPRGKSLELNYNLGDITREEIVARFNFPIIKDQDKLQADIEEAIRSEPYLFERRQDIVNEKVDQIQAFIDLAENISKARKRYDDTKAMLFAYRYTDQFDKVQSQVAKDSTSLKELEDLFKATYPFNMSDPAWESFFNKKQPNGEPIDYEQFQRILVNICRDRWAEGIFDINKNEIKSEQVAITSGDVPELMEIDDFNDLEEAWTKARVDITQAFPEENNILREIGYKIIVELMKPNVIFDKETTERRQQDRIKKVPRYQGIIMKNERIVDANTRITPEVLRKLDSYNHEIEKREKAEKGMGIILPNIGRFFLVAIILSFFFSFLKIYRSALFEDNQMLLLFSSIFLLLVAVSYLFVFKLNLSPYIIPITVAAMVITILLDARIAVLATFSLTILIAFITANKLEFVVVAMFTSVVAAYAVRKLRARAQLFTAILYIVISGIIAVTCIGILKRAEWSIIRMDLLYIAISGILAPVITYGLTALFEIIFGVTSDLTLLELTDFNRPLLKQLSQEANGTFNHSVVVGNLAESCADAIGANPLLCRVGAYYHDIGKMVRPEYFIENQFSGENKHENLSSTLSTKIIANHVKDGLKLAKEYHLPPLVADFIPMHHGTTRIEYFYQKALSEANGDPSKVNEIDFRYSGPKPNTKETGILMICEAVEAAVRSIKNPTLKNIEAMVDRIIEKRLKEGQLDDCPLTMADFARMKGDIRGSTGLIPVLKGIYHIRIEYPEKKPDSRTSHPTIRK